MVYGERVPPETVRGLKRSEYERLAVTGVFESERVELLYGAIVRMSAKGPTHEAVIERLNEALVVLALAGRASVRIQCAFAASDDSEPEPDVAVVPRKAYDEAPPSSAHLLIEVAESSLRLDRTTKAKLYAESGVPEYWVVNLVDRRVEVYTEPARGEYTRVTPMRPGEVLRPTAFPDLEIPVDRLIH